MKKISIILLVLICFAGCNNKSNSIESQFLNDFEKAILNRLDMSKNNSTHEEIVNSEYPILSKYNDAKFSDTQLKEICELYLSGLNTQKEAIDSKLEYSEYDIKWQEGLIKRYQAIEKIYKNYDVFKNNEQQIENSYINQLKQQEDKCKALKEISSDLESQLDKATLNYNGYAFEIPFTNNTDYTYDITLYFTLYNSKDERVGYETTHFENIKPKIKNKFEIYMSLPNSSSGGTWNCEYSINSFK